MRLFPQLPPTVIDRYDRAAWTTIPFDLQLTDVGGASRLRGQDAVAWVRVTSGEVRWQGDGGRTMRDQTFFVTPGGAPNTDVTFQNRVVAPDATGTAVSEEGNALAAADVSSITYAVYDYDSATPSTPVVAATALTASTVFIALTDDNAWNEDSTGCNFRHTFGGSVFTSEGHTYVVVYTVTLTGGKKRVWSWKHHVYRLTPA